MRSLVGFICPFAASIALLANATCGRGSRPNVAATDAGPSALASDDSGTDSSGPSCPDDMVLVDTSFCPDIQRRCTDLERERKNHLSICHAFAPEQTCNGEERRIAFCIDRYEYPNRKGAHPARMLDWYQAQATCESDQKRLCWASEWTAACEGPEHTPFPYGWARDHDACNMDNFYIDPKRPSPHGQFFFYSKNRDVALPELSRLDQSVPCGSMESCKSGFGVYDMTGNVDEWVTSDEPPRERSQWAGLKGGAWGHVRNQCRPMTTSHEPGFAYYFVGFRCCRDAAGHEASKWDGSPLRAPAPLVAPRNFASERADPASATGPSKAKFSRTGRPE
jgi:sulfatase modifying factor 1